MAHEAMDQEMRDGERKECETVGPQGSESVKVTRNVLREHHEATEHVAHAEWCTHCVTGRHRKERTEHTVPATTLDHCFPEGVHQARTANTGAP